MTLIGVMKSEFNDFDNSSSGILEELPQDVTVGDQWPPIPQRQIHLYGLCLIVIPTVTILGNLLVILSVLRFKALHSAINFLILGLAVADLFVALFVMPYAVYIYVEGGYWFLGPLMCDIYSACDVACSTASILLLSVISFDRYRAVSRPIQYSRQSQNVRRVIYILIVIWLISLIVASPIVLGANIRPLDADPYECRFYNADFSIGSSIISFVIPCFIILFVYIRIIAALRAREKAAKLRRMTHANKKSCDSSNKLGAETFDNAEDPGGIVAAPVRLLSAAASSIDEQDLAGNLTPRSSTDSLSNNVNVAISDFMSEGPTTLSRRSSEADSSCADRTISSLNSAGDIFASDARLKSSEGNNRSKFANFAYSHQRSLNFSIMKTNARTSNVGNRRASRSDNILPAILRQFSKRSPKLFRSTPPIVHSSPHASADSVKGTLPILENTEAGEEAKLDDPAASEEHESPTDFELPVASQTETETLSISVTHATPRTSYASSSPCPCSQAIISRMPLLEITENENSKGTTTILVPNANFLDFCNAHVANSNGNAKRPNGESPCTRRRPPPIHAFSFIDSEQESTKVDGDEIMDEACIIGNPHANDIQSPTTSARGEVVASPVVHTPPVVTFDMTVHEMNSSRTDGTAAQLPPAVEDKTNEKDEFPLLQSAIIAANLLPNSTSNEYFPAVSRKEASSSSIALTGKDSGGSFSSTNTPSKKTNRRSLSVKKRGVASSLGTTRSNGSSGGFAVRIVKRTMIRKESSLKRKVSKSQRKEKRATKTLGIVVGIFLICWVPFFSMNILNAICIKIDSELCQIGYGPFFYSTWIGYMNSFMNPIIYTIFNTEFRRAFKSILLGRKQSRGRMRLAAFNKGMRQRVHL